MRNEPGYSEVREYAWLLWVHKWSVLTILAAVVLAEEYTSSSQPVSHVATAEVYVKPPSLNPVMIFRDASALNLEPQRNLAESPVVAHEAASRLGDRGTATTLVVQAPLGTSTLVFVATSPTAHDAQRTAQAYAEAYLTVRRQSVKDDLERSARPIKERIASLQAQIDDVQSKLMAAVTPADRDALRLRLDSLTTDRQSAAFALDGLGSGDADIGAITRSAQSAFPLRPDRAKPRVMAIGAGLAFGCGQVFLRARLRPRIHSRTEGATQLEAPVLGLIPRGRLQRTPRHLVTLVAPRSAAAHGFRALRARTLLEMRREGVSSILVTSSRRGAGATSTAVNLAVSIAQAGLRVALVSVDLVVPALRAYFPESTGCGLGRLLGGARGSGDALEATPVAGLRVLHAGEPDPNTAERLVSRDMADSLQSLEAEFDFVVIDAPPVLEGSDTLSVASLVNAVVVVAAAERTSLADLAEARQRLGQVGARVLGGVLTGVRVTRLHFEQRAKRSGSARPAPVVGHERTATAAREASTPVRGNGLGR